MCSTGTAGSSRPAATPPPQALPPGDGPLAGDGPRAHDGHPTADSQAPGTDAGLPQARGQPAGEASPAGLRPPRQESARHRRARARLVAQRLRERYPQVRVPLAHRTPLQLLVATILSAQCTDATVNRVTPALFARFPSAKALAQAPRDELERLIHPTGFFRQKARMIQTTCQLLLERYGGEVPRRTEELVRLPGVGRKTANVLLSAAALQGWPGWKPFEDGLGIVVDTHVGRLARRLAFTFHRDPEKVEQDLQQLFERREWPELPLRLIYFGRQVCTARRPRCPQCPLLDLCPAGPHLGATPWLEPGSNRSPEPGAIQQPPPDVTQRPGQEATRRLERAATRKRKPGTNR